MKKLLLTLVIIFLPITLLAQEVMESDAYKMQSDSINFSGLFGSSTNYGLEDTLGELDSGQIDSTNYRGYMEYQFMGFGVADIQSPSAPTNLTASVISSSEVELTWDASTDDYGVDRYYIYRNGLRVDDVAAFPRSFSDSGLSENTTYSYNVSAVDDAANESLWSATTTATTMSSVSSGGGLGGTRTVFISNLELSANDINAVLNFDTSLVRSAEVYWGRDGSYSDGVAYSSMGNGHRLIMSPLLPQTFYQIRIVLKDEYGNQKTFENISFRTLAGSLSQLPPNVTSFDAMSVDNAVNLSWNLPLNNRIVGVRVVRSSSGYPSYPEDGQIVFENSDASGVEYFVDTSVELDRTYYYAIFTKDLAGNLSSGVLSVARVGQPTIVPTTNPLDELLPAGRVDEAIEVLRIEDFLFIQSGDSVDVSNNTVNVSNNKNLTVALKYYRVPEILKTIAVTLSTNEPESRYFTFILRPNRDKTRYEATIAPLSESKTYDLRIDIIDYQNQGLKTLKGVLVTHGLVSAGKFVVPEWFGMSVTILSVSILVLWLIAYAFKYKHKKLPLINTNDGLINKQV